MPIPRTENFSFVEGVKWAIEYLCRQPDGKDIILEAKKKALELYPPYTDFPPASKGNT